MARTRGLAPGASRGAGLLTGAVSGCIALATWDRLHRRAALDNVALLPMLAGMSNGKARERAREMLAALDVAHRAHAQVPQLSGGGQQRVAIARALVNQPPIILADEPTAPLDSERALTVVRILHEMAPRFGTAIIVVTHETVYVVDDDEAVRRFLRGLIGSIGLGVKTYASAQEFLDDYEAGSPGCLLLDIRMPEMSGLELQAELRRRQIDIPVIILTSHGDVKVAVHAMKAGAVDFVEKPFSSWVGLVRGGGRARAAWPSS